MPISKRARQKSKIIDVNGKMDEAFSDKSCLKEFCEETSLAGFKYMLPQYGPTGRRLFWSFICLLFSGLTLYQLFLLFASYLRSPLTVIISKSYHESLQFPAVVLCNSMPFRVSRIRPQSDMHRALSDMYDSPTLNSTSAGDYAELLSTIRNTRDYLEEMAFDKQDMIVRCVWKNNETCSASDFHPIIVGNKICYAFNSGYNGSFIRRTENSGEHNGLELTLNVETYEKMQGPYSTFGISVGFVAEGNTPTMQGAIDTLIGAKTKIGLTHKEVYYSKGLTCDERVLKHHSKYSRTACVLEQQAERAMNVCKCYPFTVPQANLGPNDTMCDLYQHFACAELELANAVNISEETCPPECFTVLYEATVSQSLIAWDRAQTQMVNSNSDLMHLKKKLGFATEISHRFDPKSNLTTTLLLEKVSLAVKEVEQIVKDINSLSCVLSVPLSGELPPVAQSFRQFQTQFMSSDQDSIIPNLQEVFINLNQSLTNFGEVFFDPINSELILKNRTQRKTSIEELGFSTLHFTIFKDNVYLKTLELWLSSLLKLKSYQNTVNETSILKQLKKFQSKDIDDKNRQSSLPDWVKILPGKEIEQIGDHLSTLSRIGFNKGCLDEAYDETTQLLVNSTDILLLSDVVTCLNYHFSDPKIRDDKMTDVSKVIALKSEEKDDTKKPERSFCETIMCDVVEDSKTADCYMHPDRLNATIQNVLERIFPIVWDCMALLDSVERKINNFVAQYENDVLPTFSEKSEQVMDYKTSLSTIKKTLNNRIWPHDILTELNSIHENVTGYVNKGMTYANFSSNITIHFKSWFDNSYMFANNEARSKLNILISNYNDINVISDIFNDTISSSGEENEGEVNRRSFAVLASELLWQTNTSGKIDEVLNCVSVLQSETATLLERLPHVTAQLQHAILDVFKDAEAYLESLEVDTSFYQNNFMAVNVFFNELSKDITKQNSAYNFWNLMADIGGSSGLWLGFCMITLVELFETAVRHCFFRIGKWVYRKNESALSRIKATDALVNWKIIAVQREEDEEKKCDQTKTSLDPDLPERQSLLDELNDSPRIDKEQD